MDNPSPPKSVPDVNLTEVKEKIKKEVVNQLQLSNPAHTDTPSSNEVKLKDEVLCPSKIVVKPSTLHRYGVFATEDISKHDIIEQAIYVRTSYRLRDLVYPEILNTCYVLPCNCDECKWRGNYLTLCAGYIQAYNCSETEKDADVGFSWFTQDGVVEVRAIKDIKKGKEILVWYGSSSDISRINKPS